MTRMIGAAIDWSNRQRAVENSRLLARSTVRNTATSLQQNSLPPAYTLEHALDRPSAFVDFGPTETIVKTEWLHLRISADARIDNRPELWEQLRGAPYLAQDSSDDLMILAAYARWGEQCAQRLVGDFAFVIFDERHETAFAACDAMNMRPLHYACSPSGLCLATDAQQLLSLPFVSQKLNELALGLWVSGYPDPSLSMYADVTRLRPGHSLSATRQDVHTTEYWDIDAAHRLRYRNKSDYAEHFRELLTRAVADRVGTHTTAHPQPIATQLSGGMDSPSVAALAASAAKTANRPISAISHRYPGGSAQDESSMIDTIVDHIGFNQHHYVDANHHSELSYADLYPPHADSPGTVLSPRYHDDLAIAAASGSRVLLTGSGGDEMCWGHSLSYSKRLKRGDLSAVQEVIKGSQEHELPVLSTLRGLFVTPLAPRALVNAAKTLRGSKPQESWLSNEARHRLGIEDHIETHSASDKTHDPVFAARYNALRWSSTIHSVRSHAVVAREYGVEICHPFFDRRIAEFSFAIPDELWLREGQPKWLLRQAMAGNLPSAVLEHRNKVTFDGFFLKLLQKNRDAVRETLAHEHLYASGIAIKSKVLNEFDETMDQKRPFHVNLLYVLQLQSWFKVSADRGSFSHLSGRLPS